MTMTEILEENKEKLIRQLDAASSPDAARPVLEETLDRMLYRYNEESASDRVRAAAADLIRSVRTAVPLVSTVGDVKIWERNVSGGRNRKGRGRSLLFPVFLISGAALAVVMLLTQTRLTLLPTAVLLTALSAVCLFLAGRFSAVSGIRGGREQMTECVVDSEAIYRIMHAVMMVIDQNLGRIELEDRMAEKENRKSDAAAIPEAELALFSGLLDASYSRDSEYAFEKLDELRYYLHTKHVDVVDYSDENAAWFDVMPSESAGTLRPALVMDGRLLKKGMASAGSR